MSLNSKPISGNNDLTINLTNDDLNASWLTMSASTITSSGSVFANSTVDLLALVQTKQDIITSDSDLTVGTLTLTGDLIVATNDLYVDTANSYVGIRNNAPIQPLHVNGNIQTDDTLILSRQYFSDDTKREYILQCDTSPVNSFTMDYRSSNADGSVVDTTQVMEVSVGGSLGMLKNITAGGNISATGNLNGAAAEITGTLSIGTTSTESGFIASSDKVVIPTEAGVHAGLISNKAGITLASSGGNGANLDFTLVGDEYKARINYNYATDILQFYVGGSNQLTIADGSIDFQDCNITNGTGVATLNNLQSNYIGVGTLEATAINNTGDMLTLGSGTFSGDILTTNGNILTTNGDITATNGTISGNIISAGTLETTGDLNINSGVLFVDASTGNVGIGNSSPESALVVYGSKGTVLTQPGIHMGLYTTTNQPSIELVANAGVSSYIDFTQVNVNNKARIIYSAESDQFRFSLNSSDKITISDTDTDFSDNNITTSGNITASSGSITAHNDITATTGNISAPSGAITAYDNVSTISGNIISAGTLEATGNLNINSGALFVDATAGNVGIGNAAPESALVVSGTKNEILTQPGVHMGLAQYDQPSIELVGASGTSSYIDFSFVDVDKKARILYGSSADKLIFITNDNYQMTIGNATIDCIDNDITTTGTISTNGGNITTDSNIIAQGSITASTGTFNNDLTVLGGIDVLNTTLYVEDGLVGINTDTPQEALYVNGSCQVSDKVIISRNETVGVNPGNRRRYHMECADTSETLDFYHTKNDTGADDGTLMARFNDVGNLILFEGDLQVNSGVIDGNLNGTRGQILMYIGEENTTLTLNDFDFNYGNGAVSTTIFGVPIPFDCKFMRFAYVGGGGSQPSTTSGTSTKYVFQAWQNGSALGVYIYIDFVDTTHGNATYHKFSNKFSSSPTSQVDYEYEFNGSNLTVPGGGVVSWKTITLENTSTDTKHRMTFITQTTEDI